jgi:hypothetical protein
MTQDFEQIPAITNLANSLATGELAFTFPEVIEAIHRCSANNIAVLGVEIFLVRNGGYYASGCSTYELQLERKWTEVRAQDWNKYVQENNTLAEESVRSNPTGDDHVYVLTTSSLREFCAIQEMKRR